MKISTVYDSIVTQLDTLFSSKLRIPNPYDLEGNPLLGKEMYGFKIGDASSETLEFCAYSINRNVTVILLNKFSRNESKSDSFDSMSKKILEDTNSVLNLFLKSEELTQYAKIEKIDLTGISGIQSLSNNNETYLFTEISFNILISEVYI